MNTLEIPEIETDRLRLRAHRPGDLDACLAMWSDAQVTRFIGGKSSTEQQTWARLVGYVGQWTLLGFGYWAVEEKTTNQFIGELGFADFKRDIDPSMRDVPELGWALASPFHGQGYGTEAVQAATAWGDAHLTARRTVCLIDVENLASRRVAHRCGYLELATVPFNGRPTIFLERLRSGLVGA